jgi:Domain of unknown function (DUF4337)
MPEDAEVETERLHEAIHDELEREATTFLRRVAMTTAILAALAAVAALLAGATVNEALVLKTEAARLQTEASDTWAHYQAREIKAAIQEAERQTWLAANRSPPAEIIEKAQHYEAERESLEQAAHALEHARDEKSREADQLLRRHDHYAYGVTLFQIAIALGAIAALTRTQGIWFVSLGAGIGGIGFFVLGLLSMSTGG